MNVSEPDDSPPTEELELAAQALLYFLDGLSPDEADAFEVRLSDDATCQRALADAVEWADLLRAAGQTSSAPEPVTVAKTVSQPSRRQRRLFALSFGGVLMAVVLAGVVGLSGSWLTDNDTSNPTVALVDSDLRSGGSDLSRLWWETQRDDLQTRDTLALVPTSFSETEESVFVPETEDEPMTDGSDPTSPPAWLLTAVALAGSIDGDRTLEPGTVNGPTEFPDGDAPATDGTSFPRRGLAPGGPL